MNRSISLFYFTNYYNQIRFLHYGRSMWSLLVSLFHEFYLFHRFIIHYMTFICWLSYVSLDQMSAASTRTWAYSHSSRANRFWAPLSPIAPPSPTHTSPLHQILLILLSPLPPLALLPPLVNSHLHHCLHVRRAQSSSHTIRCCPLSSRRMPHSTQCCLTAAPSPHRSAVPSASHTRTWRRRWRTSGGRSSRGAPWQWILRTCTW